MGMPQSYPMAQNHIRYNEIVITIPNLNKVFGLITDNYPHGKIVCYETYKYSTPRGF